MLWVPQKGGLRVASNLSAVGAATMGTNVTSGGTSSTKTSPATQLIASTPFDAYGVLIGAIAYGAAATASEGALDILVGAATERMLIPNLLMGYTDINRYKHWWFPLYIPAGTRIAAATAGLRTSTACEVCIWLFGGDGGPKWRVGSKVTTYGMGTVPLGTAITPGASGVEGSWTQIVAATTEDHWAFLPSFQVTNDTTVNQRRLAVDIGIGAATEEEIGQWAFITDSNESMVGPLPYTPAFVDVPSGTRLTMRASNSGANDAGYNGVIHAVS